MKSRILPVAAAVVLLLLFLVVQAPARLLASVVPAQQLALQGLSGSLWQGHAARAVLTTPHGPVHLGAVDWRLRPGSLLLLSPTLELQSNWGAQRASGEVTLRGAQDLDLKEFELDVGADLVKQFLPVQLEGRVTAQLQRLSVRQGWPASGEGRLVWQNGSWLSPRGPLLLGSYGLDFVQAEGEPLRGEVVTLSGPVQAEGNVTFDAGEYRLDISVSGEGGLDEQMSQALSLLANPGSDGSFRVQLQGAL